MSATAHADQVSEIDRSIYLLIDQVGMAANGKTSIASLHADRRRTLPPS
jgi:hypothetical protein